MDLTIQIDEPIVLNAQASNVNNIEAQILGTGYEGKQDVYTGYLYNGIFYRDEDHTQVLSGLEDTIYINLGSTNEDFYRYNGTSYLRTGKDSLTKEQADTYYASKVHTHLFSDISNVSFLSKQEIENILNQEE